MIDSKVTFIKKIVEEYGNNQENLLPVLEKLNKEFSYLDYTIINEIARAFKLSQTEVYGIASFYHFLNLEPVGKYIIRLCNTISCDLSGKNQIVKVLEAELGIKMGETTEDKIFTLSFANCMGMCDRGPAMLVNDKLYSNLTPSKNS